MKKKLVAVLIIAGLIVGLGFGTAVKEVEEGQKVAYIGHGA